MGMFYLAIPAWLANEDASALEIAAVVSMFSLPWSLKLVNGFFMDRYTYLPMGRRRIWIIGAQSLMALGLLACAIIAPGARDIFLLSLFAFVISAATTFQDVAIDSLIVDIMDEKDQAKSGGIMFGAQILGMSGATAATGYLLDHFGARMAFGAAAGFLLIGVIFAVILRERPGEKRFPWSRGAAHQRNIDIKIDAWLPLLKQSLKAILGPASVIILPFLLLRNIMAVANFGRPIGAWIAGLLGEDNPQTMYFTVAIIMFLAAAGSFILLRKVVLRGQGAPTGRVSAPVED